MRSILRASQFTPTLLWQRSRWYVSVFSRCNSPAQPASESGRIRKSARRANLTRTTQQMWWNDSPSQVAPRKPSLVDTFTVHTQSLGISPLPNYVPSQTAARIAEPCLSSHGPEETSVLRLQAAAAAPSEQGPGILWVLLNRSFGSARRVCRLGSAGRCFEQCVSPNTRLYMPEKPGLCNSAQSSAGHCQSEASTWRSKIGPVSGFRDLHSPRPEARWFQKRFCWTSQTAEAELAPYSALQLPRLDVEDLDLTRSAVAKSSLKPVKNKHCKCYQL